MGREPVGRPALAALAKEYLLCGHLIDRGGMPHVIGQWGIEDMTGVAIDEWMGASPVYTRRIQRLLGIVGRDDVATVFKGMQFDIGAPHRFLDFRYAVTSATEGEFWLDHCGALADVEPMGEEFVVAMCHHIEDPTFDATAWATNPRARIRPIHRPPRVPADRTPHCHWTIRIDPEAEPLPEPGVTQVMAATRAARLPLPSIRPGQGPDDGRADYSGEFDPDLRLADFSEGVLLAAIDELCLQGHLLTMSFLAAVEARHGTTAAIDVGVKQMIGIAGVAADRLARHLGAGADLEGLAAVLDAHPLLRPRSYVAATVTISGAEIDLTIADCPALGEDRLSWIGLLTSEHIDAPAALEAICQAVDPGARVESTGDRSWRVTVGHAPAPERDEVMLARFSTGVEFDLDG